MNHRTPILKKSLLKESVQDKLSQDLMILYSDSKKILNDFDEIWDLNLKLLSTWGAALGGIMLPMKKWIEEKFPQLSYKQVILVLMGSIVGFYYDNEYFITNILRKIKKEGLLDQFKQSVIMAQRLNNSLNTLLDNIHFYGDDFVDYLSFAFVLPMMEDLKNFVNSDNLEIISDRMVNSGFILTSKSKMKFFLSKLLELSQ
jgi:hypothetical protein